MLLQVLGFRCSGKKFLIKAYPRDVSGPLQSDENCLKKRDSPEPIPAQTAVSTVWAVFFAYFLDGFCAVSLGSLSALVRSFSSTVTSLEAVPGERSPSALLIAAACAARFMAEYAPFAASAIKMALNGISAAADPDSAPVKYVAANSRINAMAYETHCVAMFFRGFRFFTNCVITAVAVVQPAKVARNVQVKKSFMGNPFLSVKTDYWIVAIAMGMILPFR